MLQAPWNVLFAGGHRQGEALARRQQTAGQPPTRIVLQGIEHQRLGRLLDERRHVSQIGRTLDGAKLALLRERTQDIAEAGFHLVSWTAGARSGLEEN